MVAYLFVYGTLMHTFDTSITRFLKEKSHYISHGYTNGLLYDLGSFPGMVYDPSASTTVKGDVFLLKAADEVLSFLDYYEGINADTITANMYKRIKCKVLINEELLECYTYHYQQSVKGLIQIENGDYQAYLQAHPNTHDDFLNQFRD